MSFGSSWSESQCFELRERVDIESGEAMLSSDWFRALKDEDEAYGCLLESTVALARTLGGSVPVRYYMLDHQEEWGRMKATVNVEGIASLPFTRMKKAARAALANKYYWDVDMANCHPSLLLQQLERHGLSCPRLRRYVQCREDCIREVMDGCNVSRDDAKELFIRLMFFGGVKGWVFDHPPVTADMVPRWLYDLKDELRTNGASLLKSKPDLRSWYQRRYTAYLSAEGTRFCNSGVPAHMSNDPLATQMAILLQTLERECVTALVKTIQDDDRVVGSIIYDGILIEKVPDEACIPTETLRRWEDAVSASTNMRISLTVKDLRPPEGWNARASFKPVPTRLQEWIKGRLYLSYAEAKSLWERNTFKIIKSNVYVMVSDENGDRCVFSDKKMSETYKQLHYSETCERNGKIVVTSKPFIARWERDPQIKTYDSMECAPPPMTCDTNTYNIWSGFAIEHSSFPDVNPDSDAVKRIIEFVYILCNRKKDVSDYLIDWIAQIFQQPAKKTGIAILLQGEEGVGKNRLTDLLRFMMGKDRFLQTASPSNCLFGRFTRIREGKMLVVINEASGTDTFAANNQIKDMITCDEFISEEKSCPAYAMRCFARFLFTTNNDNVLKVNPDSRRYVIIDVSSELRGNTEYFRSLSALIDDERVRREFHAYLMRRDLTHIDWINDRPITAAYLEMVSLNLPYEHQYIKRLVMSKVVKLSKSSTNKDLEEVWTIDSLFSGFREWMVEINASEKYAPTSIKFATTLSKLVRNAQKNTGFVGISKKRIEAGIRYSFKWKVLLDEMTAKRWFAPGEV